MLKNVDTEVTPFGGIHLIHERLVTDRIVQYIDNELGSRGNRAKYKYSDK